MNHELMLYVLALGVFFTMIIPQPSTRIQQAKALCIILPAVLLASQFPQNQMMQGLLMSGLPYGGSAIFYFIEQRQLHHISNRLTSEMDKEQVNEQAA